MRTPGFTTFFFLSLCIHLAGTAAAFIISSTIQKRLSEHVNVTPIKENTDISPARLYTEIDLSRSYLEDEKPVNAQILSWESRKSRLASGKDAPGKLPAKKESLVKGASVKPQKAAAHRESAGVENGLKVKKLSSNGILPVKKNAAGFRADTTLTDESPRLIQSDNSGGNMNSHDDEPISLETTRVEYMDYFQKIQQKIDETWEYPAEAMINGDSGNSEINFQIADDGRVRNAFVFRSSGSKTLDRESVNAVFGAAPFPPIPAEIGRNRLNIVATFRYSMDFGAGNQEAAVGE